MQCFHEDRLLAGSGEPMVRLSLGDRLATIKMYHCRLQRDRQRFSGIHRIDPLLQVSFCRFPGDWEFSDLLGYSNVPFKNENRNSGNETNEYLKHLRMLRHVSLETKSIDSLHIDSDRCPRPRANILYTHSHALFLSFPECRRACDALCAFSSRPSYFHSA